MSKSSRRSISVTPSALQQLEALIFRALEKDRDKRFQTALEFAIALENSLPTLPETNYPSTIVANLPLAQSVADVPIPPPRPGTVVRAEGTKTRQDPPKPPPPPPPMPTSSQSRPGRG